VKQTLATLYICWTIFAASKLAGLHCRLMQLDSPLCLCISGQEAPLVAARNGCAEAIAMQGAAHLCACALDKPTA